MNQIILVTTAMQPVPEGITIVQDYGWENIKIGEAWHDQVGGNCMMLSGEPEAFIDWLQQFDGVWATNNPMIGDWHVVHVKQELARKKITDELLAGMAETRTITATVNITAEELGLPWFVGKLKQQPEKSRKKRQKARKNRLKRKNR